MTIDNFIIQPFYSISTNMPLGACWVAEDLDGNKALVYLRRVERKQNIYAYHFVMWNGEEFCRGEETSIRKCWRKLMPYLRSNASNGLIPDLEITVNYYSGRPDHER